MFSHSLRSVFSWSALLFAFGLTACQTPETPEEMPPPPPPVLPQAHPKDAQFPICPQGWCWENPTTGGNAIRALWGTQEKDIWAVGDYGTILHYDGTNWSQVPSPTKAHLTAVWGSGFDNVYVVGTQGTLLHYTEISGTFTPISLSTTSMLWSIWGNSENNIWVVGEQGALFHFDGHTFTLQHFLQNPNEETNYYITGIWGNSKGDLWLVGSETTVEQLVSIKRTGTTWQPPVIQKQRNPLRTLRVGIIGFETNELFVLVSGETVVNEAKELLYHAQNDMWQELETNQLRVSSSGSTTPYQRIWGLSADDLWLPSPEGAWNYHDGIIWNYIDVPQHRVSAVWGTSKTNVWLALGNGALAHFNGKQIDFTSDALMGKQLYKSLWVQNNNQIQAPLIDLQSYVASLLTGYKDHFMISSLIPARTIWPIDDTYAWLQSEGNHLWFFDGNSWKEDRLFPQLQLLLLNIQGSSFDQVLAVGDVSDYPIYSFNGSSWKKQEQLTKDLISSTDPKVTSSLGTPFFVNSLQDAWFSGKDCITNKDPCDRGTIYWLKHFQHGTITSSPTQLLKGPILSVWGSDPGHLWAVDGVVSGLYFSDGQTPLFYLDPTAFGDANKNKEHPLQIWGRSADDFWVRTKENSMFHFDGKAWHQTKLPAPFDENAKMAGSKQGDGVWVGGGSSLLHYHKELDKTP